VDRTGGEGPRSGVVYYLGSELTRQYVPVATCGLPLDNQGPASHPSAAGAAVRLTGVLDWNERRGRLPAAGISLVVPPGQSVALHSRDDSTAVSVLDVVAGLRRPRQGQVTVDGVAVHRLSGPAMERYRGERGIITDRFPLLSSLSVTDNVLAALRSRRVGAAARARAAELLGTTDAASLAARRVETLSPEQQWRILIARALLSKPRLVLAEDPAPGLGVRAAGRVLDLLTDLHARLGFTLLLATDRLATAVRCQRLVSLERGAVSQDELTGDDAWTRGRIDRIG